jgi:hypothetical protein
MQVSGLFRYSHSSLKLFSSSMFEVCDKIWWILTAKYSNSHCSRTVNCYSLVTVLYWTSYVFPTVKFGSSFGTYPVSLRRSDCIPVALCTDLLLFGSWSLRKHVIGAAISAVIHGEAAVSNCRFLLLHNVTCLLFLVCSRFMLFHI